MRESWMLWKWLAGCRNNFLVFVEGNLATSEIGCLYPGSNWEKRACASKKDHRFVIQNTSIPHFAQSAKCQKRNTGNLQVPWGFLAHGYNNTRLPYPTQTLGTRSCDIGMMVMWPWLACMSGEFWEGGPDYWTGWLLCTLNFWLRIPCVWLGVACLGCSPCNQSHPSSTHRGTWSVVQRLHTLSTYSNPLRTLYACILF